ncbi:hepatitis A virus cellular receptor 1-like, partial [Olea europaea var. sylvestris]|uniref:hepatitis A virus cellular receptor 1-like n=1 Tax=Olea europaea var. sylvestris TaxID=158386 RepID=UPI000C1CEA1D
MGCDQISWICDMRLRPKVTNSRNLITETLSTENAKSPTAETRSISHTTIITLISTTLPTVETRMAEDPTTNRISTTLPTVETQADGQATRSTTNTIPTISPTVETQTVGQLNTNTTPAVIVPPHPREIVAPSVPWPDSWTLFLRRTSMAPLFPVKIDGKEPYQ